MKTLDFFFVITNCWLLHLAYFKHKFVYLHKKDTKQAYFFKRSIFLLLISTPILSLNFSSNLDLCLKVFPPIHYKVAWVPLCNLANILSTLPLALNLLASLKHFNYAKYFCELCTKLEYSVAWILKSQLSNKQMSKKWQTQEINENVYFSFFLPLSP